MDDIKQIDIVQRLRYQHMRVDIQGRWLAADTAIPIAQEAADEIEDLRVALESAYAVIDDYEDQLGVPRPTSVEPSA